MWRRFPKLCELRTAFVSSASRSNQGQRRLFAEKPTYRNVLARNVGKYIQYEIS
jgi:hypothetical protein